MKKRLSPAGRSANYKKLQGIAAKTEHHYVKLHFIVIVNIGLIGFNTYRNKLVNC
jgi:hypothetical protein